MQDHWTLKIDQREGRFYGSCAEAPEASGEGPTLMVCVKYLVQSIAVLSEAMAPACSTTVEVLFRGKNTHHRVELLTSLEGVAVSCPDLPGCHSQGDDAEEALENIQAAILDYLEIADQEQPRGGTFVKVA